VLHRHNDLIMTRQAALAVLMLTVGAAVVAPAAAQSPSTGSGQAYPVKPVRFIVPFAAGGPNDSAVRPLSQKLQELLGQPFIVDYRAGANGIIGSEYVAKSAPDGYTLLVISSSFTINTAMYAKLPFDPVRDFAPVGSIATGDIIFVVNTVVPARTVKEFVALARASPGKISYGSSGVGGSLHLGGELLSFTSDIKMVHVPYKGAILALTDVIGGHVDAMFVAGPAAIPQVRAGKVRALAVASRRRAPALPDVPTFAEAGFAGVEVDSRYGILAPAATPRDTVARLNAAIVKALATTEVRERYVTMGMESVSSAPQEYADHLRNEMVKLRKVVAAAKLPLQ
jgi:tripartite-type tricarboxylate transporter receptor subunit TctC